MEDVKGVDQSNFLLPIGSEDDKKKKKSLADLAPGIPTASAFATNNASSVAFIPPTDTAANARGASIKAFKDDINSYVDRLHLWQTDVNNIEMRYNSEVDQAMVDYKNNLAKYSTDQVSYGKYLQPSQVDSYINALNNEYSHPTGNGGSWNFGKYDSMIAGKSLTQNEKNQISNNSIVRNIKDFAAPDFDKHILSMIGTLSSIPDTPVKPVLATIASPNLPNRPTLGNMPNGNPNPGGSGRG